MAETPTLVFIPGSWHKPICYEKIIKLLEDEHSVRCRTVTLPSTLDNPQATFKDDLDAAREVVLSEINEGRDVIVIAHSYGGMVGNSVIKGLARPKGSTTTSSDQPQARKSGYVVALILIASGFTITGFAFMDPLLGLPLPQWVSDKETGYAKLIVDPREFFYHDLPEDEGNYWVSQLTTQSLKALFEGGEYVYAGWYDVPNWYIGTVEDQGLPVVAQRVQVGAVRGQGIVVHHTELQSSHSPFLSMPGEVVEIIMGAVQAVSDPVSSLNDAETSKSQRIITPGSKLSAPTTWFKFGIPLLIGRLLGWTFWGFMPLRRLWTRK